MGTDVAARPGCSGIDPASLDAAADAASEVLFALSGRQYTGGGCTATVRPAARPSGWSPAAWAAHVGGWYTPSWGAAAALSMADQRYLLEPPEIELGAYPVTAITQVLIDGIIIPPAEYRVDNQRVLVRVLPTQGAAPTERWGWPVVQRLDLPATEPGTFQVSFIYGQPPPPGGVNAAVTLAAEIALSTTPSTRGGPTSRLPSRVTTVTRQGVSAVVMDPMDFITKGRTGLTDVDLWLQAVNPKMHTRPPQVWTPDLGRPRRVG